VENLGHREVALGFADPAAATWLQGDREPESCRLRIFQQISGDCKFQKRRTKNSKGRNAAKARDLRREPWKGSIGPRMAGGGWRFIRQLRYEVRNCFPKPFAHPTGGDRARRSGVFLPSGSVRQRFMPRPLSATGPDRTGLATAELGTRPVCR
jgi:hypothetical protein